MEIEAVKVFFLGAISVLAATPLPAQEIELPPIVVEGTFELRPHSITDLFTLHLQRQIETRQAVEEAMERSPWYYSRFWDYVGVMRLESSSGNSAQFFTPQYLSLEYQNADQALRKIEKESVFKSR